MSFEITTAFVQQYSSQITTLAQQKGSRLRGAVMADLNVVGKTAFMDQIGASEAQQITSRHGDTPLMNTPHRRRRLGMTDYNWADLIDRLDKVKTLIDPTSPYAQAGMWALGRKIDDVIIASALATAATGETGATTVTLPAANVVAVNSWSYGAGTGNAGLTISKLIEARTILSGYDNDPDEEAYFAASAKQIGNLLATTEVTSSDYNSVKALSQGTVDTFMGFRFIRLERLQTDSNGYRRCFAWLKSGLGLGIGAEPKGEITQRADKNYSWQVYAEMSVGASRLEETKVVECKCLES